MTPMSDPNLPIPPHPTDSWRVKANDDGLSDIADALGIKPRDTRYRYTLYDFLKRLRVSGALTPHIASFLSTYPWAEHKDQPADMIKTVLDLDRDSQFVMPGSMSQFAPQSVAECLFWFVTRFVHVVPQMASRDYEHSGDVLWLPTRPAHAYSFALVAMLWIHMDDLPLEYQREQILRPLSQALNQLRLSYRCTVCTADYKLVDAAKHVYTTSCSLCSDREEGEIIEAPYISYREEDAEMFGVRARNNSATARQAYSSPGNYEVRRQIDAEILDAQAQADSFLELLGNDLF